MISANPTLVSAKKPPQINPALLAATVPSAPDDETRTFPGLRSVAGAHVHGNCLCPSPDSTEHNQLSENLEFEAHKQVQL